VKAISVSSVGDRGRIVVPPGMYRGRSDDQEIRPASNKNVLLSLALRPAAT
jgi:hypothetical protein